MRRKERIISGCYGLLPYVVSALIASVAGSAYPSGVIFRYLPGSSELSSTVVTRGVEIGQFLDPRERMARWPGTWGYEPIWAAEFEGASSTLWGGPAANLNQPAGPRLTAEVWLRLSESAAHHTLLSNRIGSLDGFTLGLQSGVPYFVLVSGGETYRVSGTEEVLSDTDVWIAATVEYTFSNTLVLRLYRDGNLEAEETKPSRIVSPYEIKQPFYVGTDATGTETAPVLTGTITGLVFAAVVRDYVAHPLYLNTSPPFDGSTYFGKPAFHDYELEGFALPMDQRIDTYSTAVVTRLFLPHVNDAFIPQGTAVVSDDLGQAELVYVSYYHRTRDNRLASRRSIVTEIDVASGRVRRTFRLGGRLKTAHVGGIAVVGDALYVASEGWVERYVIPKFEAAGGRYFNLLPDPNGSRAVLSKASFVSSYQDTLWVGDYRTSGQAQPYLYGYPLDATGLIKGGAIPVKFRIPRRIQGVDFHAVNNRLYVFMARNRNSRVAEVLRFRRSALLTDATPVWDVSITFPHGIEDLAFTTDGTLWTNSESGTDYYQRTAEWSSFYPFVYGVASSEILTNTERGPRGHVPIPDPRLEVFPNPAADRLHIRYSLRQSQAVHLKVVDLLGRVVKRVSYPAKGSGVQQVAWTTDNLASGAYVLVLEMEGHHVHEPIFLVR